MRFLLIIGRLIFPENHDIRVLCSWITQYHKDMKGFVDDMLSYLFQQIDKVQISITKGQKMFLRSKQRRLGRLYSIKKNSKWIWFSQSKGIGANSWQSSSNSLLLIAFRNFKTNFDLFVPMLGGGLWCNELFQDCWE